MKFKKYVRNSSEQKLEEEAFSNSLEGREPYLIKGSLKETVGSLHKGSLKETVGFLRRRGTVGSLPIIFIIPYRDRSEEKAFFQQKMKEILPDMSPEKYRLLFIHQNDPVLPFNRGAMKNIGFLVVKYLYPENYKNITLVFNDVDTTPVSKETIRHYTTTPNVIKHFYGFPHALCGIFSILAGDFEKLNGFPNYYSWGFEDNLLYQRAIRHGIHVDRTVFYPTFKSEKYIRQIHRATDEVKTSNWDEYSRYVRQNPEGLDSFVELVLLVGNKRVSYFPEMQEEENTQKQPSEEEMIEVVSFKTKYSYNPLADFSHKGSFYVGRNRNLTSKSMFFM